MSDFVQGFLSADFIRQFFEIVMSVLIALVSLILYPISALVASSMPELDQALGQISTYLDLIAGYVGWGASALAIPAPVIAMISGYYVFAFTTTFGAWAIKLIVKWKSALL